jgi:glucose-1-phosphate adenylyltransferase
VPRTANPRRVLSMVLAGGEGKRLMPLTRDRAKPGVPFGGHYRLIDFACRISSTAGFVGSSCSPSTRATA